jgi:GNAT superfamily N-acetyltransferase
VTRLIHEHGWLELQGCRIRHVEVDEGFRRRGIGRSLVERAAALVDSLIVHPTDHARPFYAACGFRDDGRRMVRG